MFTTLSMYDDYSKRRNMTQAVLDFEELYGQRLYVPHTNKQYFYFIAHGGKKYVHKSSLRFLYTNRDTYTYEDDASCCPLTREFEPIDIVSILESESLPFLPKLLDSNEHFLVYEYIEGTPIQDITEDDYEECRHIHSQSSLTPMYNSINGNMIRTPSGIKLIDFKQLDPVEPSTPFFVYLRYPTSSTLHIDASSDIAPVLSLLDAEYSTNNLSIILHQ